MRCAFSICSAWNVGKSERVNAFHEGSVNVRKRPGCGPIERREHRVETLSHAAGEIHHRGKVSPVHDIEKGT